MRLISTIYFFVAITVSLFSCNLTPKNDDTKSEKSENSKNEKEGIQEKVIQAQPSIPSKYSTVFGLIDTSGDFSTEKGTYKIISKDPIHIQISHKVIEGDLDSVIKGLTIKDFVYVVFDAFARTNIEKITITSIPLKTDLTNPKAKETYLEKYKISSTITKEKAKQIMEKYINTNNFDDLMGADLNGKKEMFMSSPKFDQLKSLNDDFVIHVYEDLVRK